MALRKILIVDDSAEFRRMLNEYLKHHLEARIFEADTAETGISKSLRVRPDVVIMDIALPFLDGLEATRRIKGRDPHCRVILLTMFATSQFKREASTLDADDFIGKKDVDERLLPAIRRCFRLKQEASCIFQKIEGTDCNGRAP